MRIQYCFALLLTQHFGRTEDVSSYVEAVTILRSLVARTEKGVSMTLHSIQYYRRFALTVAMGHLLRDGSVSQDEDYHAKMVEAIEIMKEAIAHTPKSHPEWRFKNHISGIYLP